MHLTWNLEYFKQLVGYILWIKFYEKIIRDISCIKYSFYYKYRLYLKSIIDTLKYQSYKKNLFFKMILFWSIIDYLIFFQRYSKWYTSIILEHTNTTIYQKKVINNIKSKNLKNLFLNLYILMQTTHKPNRILNSNKVCRKHRFIF